MIAGVLAGEATAKMAGPSFALSAAVLPSSTLSPTPKKWMTENTAGVSGGVGLFHRSHSVSTSLRVSHGGTGAVPRCAIQPVRLVRKTD